MNPIMDTTANQSPPPPLETLTLRPVDVDPDESSAVPPKGPKSVYFLGLNAKTVLLAHMLSRVKPRLSIVLLLYTEYHIETWNNSERVLEVSTKGVSQKRSGFEYEAHPHIKQLRERGHTSTRSSQLGPRNPIYYLVVTVRACEIVEVLKPIRRRITSRTTIVLTQAAFGVLDEINHSVFPKDDDQPIYLFADISGPMQAVSHFSIINESESKIALGKLSDGPRSGPHSHAYGSLQDLRNWLADASKEIMLVSRPDMQRIIRHRVAVECILVPLGVILHRYSYGTIVTNFTKLIKLLLDEISSVLYALAEKIPTFTIEEKQLFSPQKLFELVEIAGKKEPETRLKREHMWEFMSQDARNRRRTTIDYLNGWIVRKGRKRGIPVPVNMRLVEIFKERRGLRPDELRDLEEIRSVSNSVELAST